ncbi:MAG: cysteine desulfurase family protein [Pseudomonadota bacterium]
MDYNGSAPLHPAARAAMVPFLDIGQGNPSAGHWASDPAREAIEDARADVAGLIGAAPAEIVFTSGGTEANATAIMGAFEGARASGGHVITSAIEHDAVLRPIRHLRKRGVAVTVVPVDEFGIVNPDDVRKAIRSDTRLISVMAANNETGSLQPVADVAAIARAHGVPMHTDAAQAVGKTVAEVASLGVDFLSLAGHKFGGPKGIGALYVRHGMRFSPLILGGRQEYGRRAGTESALLAAGLGAAARAAVNCDHGKVRTLRDEFWASLQARFRSQIVLNGHLEHSVPNTLNVSFPGRVGAEILAAMPHVAATTGSACHAGCIDMSHVLIAMGKSVDVGLGTIRFSLGAGNTTDEIEAVVAELGRVLG